MSALIDIIAARVGVWALRRLFGGDCPTDVRDDYPGRSDFACLSCDAKRLIDCMTEISL